LEEVSISTQAKCFAEKSLSGPLASERRGSYEEAGVQVQGGHGSHAHVLVAGSLVSSTYEQANGKGKKSKTAKVTSWSVRADVVRRLDRGELEPDAPAATAAPESGEAAF
jgi:hypothetical protein